MLTKPVPDELSISSSSLCRNSNKECAAIRSSEIPDIVFITPLPISFITSFSSICNIKETSVGVKTTGTCSNLYPDIFFVFVHQTQQAVLNTFLCSICLWKINLKSSGFNLNYFDFDFLQLHR